MDSRVSIVNANTFSYTDVGRIKESVNKAIEMIGLKKFLKPGMNVLIKTNLVMDRNFNHDGGVECLYTQAVVVEAVLENIIQLLDGKGKIIIGDAPMQECVFDELTGFKEIIERYKSSNIEIELVDFRELTSYVKNGMHYSFINENAKGKIVNLGKNSEFYLEDNLDCTKMRVTNYDPRILPKHHHDEVHEYYVSEYLLDADVIVNMPKPKSHRKGGATIALKNLVGINTRKEFLPHHTKGSVQEGGDEYLQKNHIHALRSSLLDEKNKLEAENKHWLAKLLKFPILGCSYILKKAGNAYAEGSWYGNDTISKTIVDLNRIAIYADKTGKIRTTPQRTMIIVADMIVSGEKEGPVNPTPKNVGLIAAGTNSVCFDEAVSTLMGFDYHKIPSIVRARKSKGVLPLVREDEEALIFSNISDIDGKRISELHSENLYWFEPTAGWKNHIEKHY